MDLTGLLSSESDWTGLVVLDTTGMMAEDNVVDLAPVALSVPGQTLVLRLVLVGKEKRQDKKPTTSSWKHLVMSLLPRSDYLIIGM